MRAVRKSQIEPGSFDELTMQRDPDLVPPLESAKTARQPLLRPGLAKPLIGIAAIVLAAVVIYRGSGSLRLDDVALALHATDGWSLLFACLLTAVSFAAMGYYDVLAAGVVVPGRVPAWLAAFAGATGFAVSNTAGFHLIVGGSVRYRIYGSVGVDAADVARIVTLAFGSLSLVMAAIGGAALALDPAGVILPWHMAEWLEQTIGLLVVGTVAGLVGWLWQADRAVTLLGWRMPLPNGPRALMLTGAGVVDILTAAMALYVLMPADLMPGFPAFLFLLTVALLAGSASHVPGGLGVVEATMLVGLGAANRPDAVAALVMFRLVYYFIPFVLAGVGLLAFEARRFGAPILNGSRIAVLVVGPFAAPVLAGLVFLGGTVLLLSGSIPPARDQIAFPRDFPPLPVVEASHFLGCLTGLALLILAHGLANRAALARNAAIVLLLAGAVLALLREFGWGESLLLLSVAGVLGLFRDVFYRRGGVASMRLSPPWVLAIVMTVVAVTLTGFLAYRNVDYATELWWQFTWDGDASRFLRATFALVVVIAGVGIDALMNRPMLVQSGPFDVPPAVRRILDACPNALAQVAYLGDKQFLVAEDESAFLMFAVSGRSIVVLGDPVGNPVEGKELVWRLAEMADAMGARLAFYAASLETLPVLLDLGLSFIKTGEVARVDLARFSMAGPPRQTLRAALRRSEREGMQFSIVPKAEVPALLPQLKAVSNAWLEEKQGCEKGFSLGRFDPAYLSEFDVALIRQGGEIIAFANLWRGGDREELAVDLMRHRPNISRALMDTLFTQLFLYGQAEGYRWFNLGPAPLSGLTDHPQASVWNRIGLHIYRKGGNFYNFEGLRAFKDKFDPVWTPQFFAAPGGLGLPRSFLDATTLISGRPRTLLRR